MSGLGAPARTASAMLERATIFSPSASTRPSAMNWRSTYWATMTMSTTSPRLSRLGMEVSPEPMGVEAVTTFFFVRRSSCGISARCAAVKAPEVITANSFVATVSAECRVLSAELQAGSVSASGLLRPRARRLDDFPVLVEVGFQSLREFIRCHGHRVEGLRAQDPGDVGMIQRLPELGVETVHDLARSGRRHERADPGGHLVAGNGFRNSRNVGELLQPLVGRDAQRADTLRRERRGKSADPDEKHLHFPGGECDHRRAAALVIDLQHLRPGHL